MGTMLLRQFDELAVQAEVLIDVLYEQLIGQQSRSYCSDMRERLPIGHAMLHADRDGHCRAAAVPTLAVHQQPIRVGQVLVKLSTCWRCVDVGCRSSVTVVTSSTTT
jgi:hypothetical protein